MSTLAGSAPSLPADHTVPLSAPGWRRYEPSVPDLVFLVWALAVPTVLANRLLNGDGDLARHLRVGSHVLERGGLFYRDPFSYTMEGRPFVPYEWLSEVAVALAYRGGGLAGVAVLSALLIAATYFLVALFLRRRGVDPLLAYLAAMAAAALGGAHWLARPHLFTLLGTILLLELLEGAGRRRLLLFVPLFAVWANLHGGFLFGLVVIGVYLAGDLLEARVSGDRHAWTRRARYHGAALALSLGAVCLNPSGPALLGHVVGYLGEDFLVAYTLEYRSPDFHLLNGRTFLAVLLGMVAALSLARRRLPAPHLLLLLTTVAFALHSARNIPLFGLTAVPVLALALDPDWRGLGGRLLKHLRSVFAVDRERRVGFWSAGAALCLVLLALNGGGALGVPLLRARFDPAVFPVAAVERAREVGLQGRIFNHFAWGGYLLHAWPEQKVFIDGQTDFYGEALTRTYLQVSELRGGWDRALADWDVSLVVVPSGAPLAYELAREPGWRVWHRDATAVILRRE